MLGAIGGFGWGLFVGMLATAWVAHYEDRKARGR